MDINTDDYRGASTTVPKFDDSNMPTAVAKRWLQAHRNENLPQAEDVAAEKLIDTVKHSNLVTIEMAYKSLLEKKRDLQQELDDIDAVLTRVSEMTSAWSAHQPVVDAHFKTQPVDPDEVLKKVRYMQNRETD